MKRFTQKKVILPLSFLFVVMIWSPAARCEINKSKANDEYAMLRETEVMKILLVLEKKIQDQKSLEKVKEKLFTLKDSQFFLVASLSEQIVREKDKPGVDIAFLLITALIILS